MYVLKGSVVQSARQVNNFIENVMSPLKGLFHGMGN